MPEIGNGLLQVWRSQARCYKRAMNAALASRPVSDSPNIGAAAPAAPSLLAGIDAYVATLDAYNPIRMAREDIIQYERAHPDVAMIQAALGVSDEWLDTLFTDAMAMEL